MQRLILLLALAAAAPCAAQTPDPPRPPPPMRMFISPSGEPFRPTPDAPNTFETWFNRVDANHDGKIDRAEFKADALAFFEVLDPNNDGVIDGFELNVYEHKIVPELVAEVEGRAFGFGGGGGGGPPGGGGGGHRGGGGGGYGGGGGRHGGGGGGGQGQRPSGGQDGEQHAPSGRGHIALINDPEPVSAADLDVDGRVSLAEWTRTTDNRFDQLDDKQLGYLSHDALVAMLPKPPKPGKHPHH